MTNLKDNAKEQVFFLFFFLLEDNSPKVREIWHPIHVEYEIVFMYLGVYFFLSKLKNIPWIRNNEL